MQGISGSGRGKISSSSAVRSVAPRCVLQNIARLADDALALRLVRHGGGESNSLGQPLHLRWSAPPAATRLRASAAKFSMCGPKIDRTIGDDRFDRVLSAARGQAFADKDDRRDRIPVAQFARRIEKETVDCGSGSASLRRTDRRRRDCRS